MHYLQSWILVPFLLVLANPALAGGPVGIGYLKIGMSKEAVEKGSESNDFKLIENLQEYKFSPGSYSPGPGEEWYTSKAQTTLSPEPLSISLKFQNSILLYIRLALPSTDIQAKVKNDLESKYGAGSINDAREEKQCIYKNGNNFKIKSGPIFTEWFERKETYEPIRARFNEIDFKFCPADLKNGTRESKPTFSLTIEQIKENKSSGLF